MSHQFILLEVNRYNDSHCRFLTCQVCFAFLWKITNNIQKNYSYLKCTG